MKEWLMKPAKWYEFWLPQSGVVGGTICSVILYSIVFGVMYLCGR